MYFGLIRMDGVQLTFHSIPQFVNKDPMFPTQNGTFPMLNSSFSTPPPKIRCRHGTYHPTKWKKL